MPQYLHCFRYVKDTNLKANHNQSFFKETGTQLFPIRQRYKFESKSQLDWVSCQLVHYCFRYVKDTNLKANHNAPSDSRLQRVIVFDTSKIQI